jgi:hypothetical protein
LDDDEDEEFGWKAGGTWSLGGVVEVRISYLKARVTECKVEMMILECYEERHRLD